MGTTAVRPIALALVLTVAGATPTGRSAQPRAQAASTSALASVEGIYPSGDRLPANLLRLYIVFSAPMSVGESRSRLRLVEESGRTIDRAFLDPPEELWDPSGRRLTVLFDPGRVKRGLRANLEMGPPLLTGQHYRLVVDRDWLDAQGRPLANAYVKRFKATPPVHTRPDPDAWSIQTPPSDTRLPLELGFDRPMDRALLFTSLEVTNANGKRVSGSIEVHDNERRWRLIPEQNWAPGRYLLEIVTDLEDPQGNSIRRTFDTDLSGGNDADRVVPAVLTRELVVPTAHRQPLTAHRPPPAASRQPAIAHSLR